MSCSDCDYHNEEPCAYDEWMLQGTNHARSCDICDGRDEHIPDWEYTSISATQHNRGCKDCTVNVNEAHAWSNLNATNHRCNECQHEAGHNWGSWVTHSGPTGSITAEPGAIRAGQHRRTCSTSSCARQEINSCNFVARHLSQHPNPSQRSYAVFDELMRVLSSSGQVREKTHIRICLTCNSVYGVWCTNNIHGVACTLCGRTQGYMGN